MVCGQTGLEMMELRFLVTWTAVSALSEVILEMIALVSVTESLDGCPDSLSGRYSLMTLHIVDFPISVLDSIWQEEKPALAKEMMLSLLAEYMGSLVMFRVIIKSFLDYIVMDMVCAQCHSNVT